VSAVIPRLWRSTVRRFTIDEVDSIVCERYRGSEGQDGMRITLVGQDGARTPLLKRGGWSDEVVQKLRTILGDKVV
jgi:hypothetical protein